MATPPRRMTRPRNDTTGSLSPPLAFLPPAFLLLGRSKNVSFPVPPNPVPPNPVPSNRGSPRSAWRLIPYTRPSGSGRGRPLFDRPKGVEAGGCDGNRPPALAPVRSPAMRAPIRHRLRPRHRLRLLAESRIIGPRRFLLSCVLASLRDCGIRDCGRRPARARCSASQRGAFYRWGTRRLPAWQDPLGLSPEDDRRPPVRETLSVSLQRMTDGPLRERGPGSGGWRNTGPCVSPPKAFGGEQEESSGAKNVSVKGSRPAIDPSMQGDSGLVRSSS